MAKPVAQAIDHIFSSRDLCGRRCLPVWLWSFFSAILLLALLVVSGLFVGLLADRGRFQADLEPTEVALFTQLTGLPAGVTAKSEEKPAEQPKPVEQTEQAEPSVPAREETKEVDPRAKIHVSYPEYGILPSVWRSRSHFWGQGLGWLFRNVELFQSNILAAITLLVSALVFASARALCLSQLRMSAHMAALDAVAPTRRNVHRQALRLGSEDLDGSGFDTAQRLFTTDIEIVRNYLSSWIEYDIRYSLELICLGAVALSIQPLMTAQCLLFLGIVWFFIESETRKSEANSKLATELAAAELNRQAEGLRSARIVRGLGIEQVDHDHFAQHLLKYHMLSRQKDRADQQVVYVRPRNFVICAAVTCFLLFLLTTNIMVGDRELSIAGGGLLVGICLLAAPGVRAVRSKDHMRAGAVIAAEKIQKYLDQIPAVSQAVGAKFLQPLSRTLHLDSVVYQTPGGRLLLNAIDLKLESGRTYALAALDPLEGRALVSLLPRFIEPQKGRVLFDGEDIAWATLESLRAETIFVGANDSLLPGNVMDNICGGRTDYTMQQVTEAAKISHAHNFIIKLVDGYQSEVPERADQMDVSQRFRLGLARAIIRNPALLIIEEPQESLDEDTKALLADAYERICRDRTVIFLPGRMSTVKRCDQVIVLHEGKVAALGPQSKLVEVSPTYRHWEYLKFNSFRHSES